MWYSAWSRAISAGQSHRTQLLLFTDRLPDRAWYHRLNSIPVLHDHLGCFNFVDQGCICSCVCVNLRMFACAFVCHIYIFMFVYYCSRWMSLPHLCTNRTFSITIARNSRVLSKCVLWHSSGQILRVVCGTIPFRPYSEILECSEDWKGLRQEKVFSLILFLKECNVCVGYFQTMTNPPVPASTDKSWKWQPKQA